VEMIKTDRVTDTGLQRQLFSVTVRQQATRAVEGNPHAFKAPGMGVEAQLPTSSRPSRQGASSASQSPAPWPWEIEQAAPKQGRNQGLNREATGEEEPRHGRGDNGVNSTNRFAGGGRKAASAARGEPWARISTRAVQQAGEGQQATCRSESTQASRAEATAARPARRLAGATCSRTTAA